jgi:predicted dehydrogenase
MSMLELASMANRRLSSKPRIGFLGVGWIGRHRMEALLASDLIQAAGIADTSTEVVASAVAIAPGAERAKSLDELLELDLDGLVIATPSALHAQQAIAALDQGVAVFCQKPLGRTAAEAAAVVEAARRADRLLAVDLSYRFTTGMQRIRDLVRSDALGRVFAADLVFHNAYGPDKPWFYDRGLAGGGCLMDLGIHLVDLALWVLDFPEVRRVDSGLVAKGQPLRARGDQVEDYAVATLTLETGAIVRIACSWRLSAGRDAIISAAFHGAEAGAEFRNADGSFYDFTADLYRGTAREGLTTPPDDWGGRAAVAWAEQLAAGTGFDPEAAKLVEVARVLDRIYCSDVVAESGAGAGRR